jgi:hypothetical protein
VGGCIKGNTLKLSEQNGGGWQQKRAKPTSRHEGLFLAGHTHPHIIICRAYLAQGLPVSAPTLAQLSSLAHMESMLSGVS